MVAMLEELGGEVVTGVRVRSLADLPPSRVRLFDTDPRQLVDIVGSELDAREVRRFRSWQHASAAAFKVDLAVRGGVPWENADARRAGTLHLGGTFDEIAASEAASTSGVMPTRPYVHVSQPAVADATRRVGDVEPVWAYAHVPAGARAPTPEVGRAAILAQLERFAPGLGARIVASHVTTPADFEAGNPNLVGGDITGGALTLRQLVARPSLGPDPYATSAEGVFLCSSSTAPGAGVHGMCGHNAARSALRTLVC
jgi:phytoene dehydrogenase-like protein